MDYRFHESKIIRILILTLVLIQSGAFFILTSSNQKIAEDTIRDELEVGAQVFQRLLASRHRQLNQAAQVLVSDYGFRESIATQDRNTIESMLSNHGNRAEAAVLVLTGMQQEILGTVPSSVQFKSDEVAALSRHGPADSSFMVRLANVDKTSEHPSGERLFQLVSANVMAPLPIAKLTIGYAIDNQFALDLRVVTDMEFFFMSGKDDQWRLHASTIPAKYANQFIGGFVKGQNAARLVEMDGDDAYLMMPILLGAADQEDIVAVVAKPLETMMQPFHRMERTFLYLLIATVLLSVVVIYLVGRKMVRPLNTFAHIDNLTGLGNRRLFNILMERALADLRTLNKPFALLVMDLNKFKQINDTEGHDVGDIVLEVTAKRIKEVVRHSDYISRMGGDEFALILPDGDRESAQLLAQKISQAAALPISIRGKSIEVGISIGIAMAPEDGVHQFILVRKADLAMYSAKIGDLGYAFYEQEQEGTRE